MSSRFADTRCKPRIQHLTTHGSWTALYYISTNDYPPGTTISMTNDEHTQVSGEAEEIGDRAGNDRNKGPQPIIEVMKQYNLNAKDLVEASAEQLTHKMVARAMKGRQLTINSKGIVQRAMNRATSKVWTQKQLFNY